MRCPQILSILNNADMRDINQSCWAFQLIHVKHWSSDWLWSAALSGNLSPYFDTQGEKARRNHFLSTVWANGWDMIVELGKKANLLIFIWLTCYLPLKLPRNEIVDEHFV